MYNLIKKQYETGLANELDLHRAQTQVETARGEVTLEQFRPPLLFDQAQLIKGISTNVAQN